MPMPETTMNKYDFSCIRENKIWFARQTANMRATSVTSRAGYFPHQFLRFCVFIANERHSLAALEGR
jgi:hypothetical protein